MDWETPRSPKRIIDAWVGTFLADPAENADFQAVLLAENAQFQVDGLNAQLQAQQAGLPVLLLFCLVFQKLWRDGTIREGERTETCSR